MRNAVDEHELIQQITRLLGTEDIAELSEILQQVNADEVVSLVERLGVKQRAVVYRLLSKETALGVFEALDATLQSELLNGLHDADVAEIFEHLDPDDRAQLLDEVPAIVAHRLMLGLSPRERELTSVVLGYPQESAGHRMTPEYVSARDDSTVADALRGVRERYGQVEDVTLLPVLDDARHVMGMVSLHALVAAAPGALVSEVMVPPMLVDATANAEWAARRLAERGYAAVPVVDQEQRLVGLLTFDDAMSIIEFEESQDSARQGGVEPLRRPYLSTPITMLVKSRIVWLLVLAVGATLTVQVLEVFEETLAQVTLLALFVPLLIGTGGNTGNQAATTVTRALALDDVRARDIARVLGREARVGLLLGLVLGALGFVVAGLFYDWWIGLVIGLTLVAVCTVAATIGGVMPLIAKAVRVDPAVFSNPFISTFVDASGLIIYFLIAQAILGI